MVFIIVISTGDFQIRLNVLLLSFIVIFIITILSVITVFSTVFSTLERYSFATPNQNNFFIQQHDFLCRVLIE